MGQIREMVTYEMTSDKLYIYTKQTDVSDGYYDVPNVVGVWNNKFELMRYINEYRKEKWYEGVGIRTYERSILTDPRYDFGIYDLEPYPQFFITIIDPNRGCWMNYEDLVSHSSNENEGWETFPQEEFFKTFGNQPLWKPSKEELQSVERAEEMKKTNETFQKEKSKFLTIYKQFKSMGILNAVLEEVDKK